MDPGPLQGVNGTNALTAQQTHIHVHVQSVNRTMDLILKQTQVQGVNGTMDLTPQQTEVQGVNRTNELTSQQTKVQGVNGTNELTPQQTKVQGINGIMDLITSTGCTSDHGFDPTTDKSTGCKWDQ